MTALAARLWSMRVLAVTSLHSQTPLFLFWKEKKEKENIPPGLKGGLLCDSMLLMFNAPRMQPKTLGGAGRLPRHVSLFCICAETIKKRNLTVSGQDLIGNAVQKNKTKHKCQIKVIQTSKRGRKLEHKRRKIQLPTAVQLGALHGSSFGTREPRDSTHPKAFFASGEVFLIKPRAHCQEEEEEEGESHTRVRLNSAC